MAGWALGRWARDGSKAARFGVWVLHTLVMTIVTGAVAVGILIATLPRPKPLTATQPGPSTP